MLAFIARYYEWYWNRKLAKLPALDLDKAKLLLPWFRLPEPPADSCEYKYVMNQNFCGRRRLEGSPYCFWHHRSTDKYEPSVMTRYFGKEVNLKDAVEEEIRSGVTLSGAYLEEAALGGNWFNNGADLSGADLSGAIFRGAHISYGKLRETNLSFADLERAYLSDVDLTGCTFTNSKLFETKFRNNDFRLAKGLEKDCFRNWGQGLLPKCRMLETYPDQAEPMYRALTASFVAAGALDDASWSAYRCQLMRHALLRKKLSFTTCFMETLVDQQVRGNQTDIRRAYEIGSRVWLANAVEFAKSWLFRLIFGYGEKPLRVAALSLAVMLVYAALYAGFNVLEEGGFHTALYFSVVTFTTLGYGDLKPTPSFRLVAASEAIVGLLLSGVFLFTLFRRSVGRG